MNMKEVKCVNIQAEIQASAIFHTRDIRGNDALKFMEICMETSCYCCSSAPDVHNHDDRKLTEYVTKFC